jgi:hypothetical protein
MNKTKPQSFNELMYGVHKLALAYYAVGDKARAAGTAQGGYEIWAQHVGVNLD